MITDYINLTFTCILSPLEEVKKNILGILKYKEDWRIWNDEVEQKRIYFPTQEQGANFSRKFLLWEPKSKLNTTIFFSNLSDGWYTLMYNLSVRHGTELIQISSSNESDQTPITSFHYQKGKNERIVRVLFDQKWEFYQTGEKLPFEFEENYKRRKIKDRLNNNIISAYLREFGWDIESEGFWGSGRLGIYFEEKVPK